MGQLVRPDELEELAIQAGPEPQVTLEELVEMDALEPPDWMAEVEQLVALVTRDRLDELEALEPLDTPVEMEKPEQPAVTAEMEALEALDTQAGPEPLD